ncbi:helix-turn-helix domain-containing protein [Acidiferrobacter thiooxydans]|jgi:hypothetical protein|uniref:helix-turn-helix domain-containing protein n=1 Tax=Acidiferrobacter thiooxydans TaxID=163359 RepID=UPI00082522EA|nr:helix-turn-helix domain-containing protein [Acidiferrobacter thiooxydans]UEO01096.1 helix-turn-helix domain-containing protein [Acidiferrobacter thiooxydans]
MQITLADLEGMASPGWGVGDDFEEVEVAYDGGRRLGMSTADICTRLKSAHVGRFEREFSDILKTYPQNGADLKILLWLASGFSYQVAAAGLGRCYKTIKNTARRLRQFRDYGTVKLLPPEQVPTGDALTAPFPRSNAGRKPRGAEITAEIIGFDLLGNPVQARARKPRKAAPRVRVRPAAPGQMSLFQEAA